MRHLRNENTYKLGDLMLRLGSVVAAAVVFFRAFLLGTALFEISIQSWVSIIIRGNPNKDVIASENKLVIFC